MHIIPNLTITNTYGRHLTSHMKLASFKFNRMMYALNSASLGHSTFFSLKSLYMYLSVWRHLVRFSVLIFWSKTEGSSATNRAEQWMWNLEHCSIKFTVSGQHNACWVMSLRILRVRSQRKWNQSPIFTWRKQIYNVFTGHAHMCFSDYFTNKRQKLWK